ncbi:uncharacterized protein EAF02_002137 [Botrytis sinoallii]|uniref:uncharacterized protein n=1 Tax=Botrytis sinoallii TaxID=1463999 RepID=UPI001901D2C7|nr:uncharacterized protein EAF02_002137 [Botrytis sinoallii]KAF7889722.1 hypothetical protein EAF02_002137 [Botrytis sinoallii]
MGSTYQPLKPSFYPSSEPDSSPQIQEVIKALNLIPHIEGGFFAETDRAPDVIPSPFGSDKSSTTDIAPQRPGFDPTVRNSSTSIFYLLTPHGPQGGFHRNKGRTVHTLHRGRGRYVLIHADEEGSEKRIETFIVGQNVAAGEKLQWIVNGGKYKASYLLPDVEGGQDSDGLLISETVVPGFEYSDHDFLSPEGLKELVASEKVEELSWLLSPLGKGE